MYKIVFVEIVGFKYLSSLVGEVFSGDLPFCASALFSTSEAIFIKLVKSKCKEAASALQGPTRQTKNRRTMFPDV